MKIRKWRYRVTIVLAIIGMVGAQFLPLATPAYADDASDKVTLGKYEAARRLGTCLMIGAAMGLGDDGENSFALMKDVQRVHDNNLVEMYDNSTDVDIWIKGPNIDGLGWKTNCRSNGISTYLKKLGVTATELVCRIGYNAPGANSYDSCVAVGNSNPGANSKSYGYNDFDILNDIKSAFSQIDGLSGLSLTLSIDGENHSGESRIDFKLPAQARLAWIYNRALVGDNPISGIVCIPGNSISQEAYNGLDDNSRLDLHTIADGKIAHNYYASSPNAVSEYSFNVSWVSNPGIIAVSSWAAKGTLGGDIQPSGRCGDNVDKLNELNAMVLSEALKNSGRALCKTKYPPGLDKVNNKITEYKACVQGAEWDNSTQCAGYATMPPRSDLYEGTNGLSYTGAERNALRQACVYGANNVSTDISADDVAPDPSATSPDEEETCEDASKSSLGFIACPVQGAVAEAVDTVYGWILDKFHYKRLNDVESSTQMKTAWENFRNLANIGFAIVFLIIIYSTAIGGKMS